MIILLVIMIIRSRKKEEEVEDLIVEEKVELAPIPDIEPKQETEATIRRKQLEKMAKDKPEEFAKLLRTWLAEE